MNRGKYLVIEGGEGTGKSLQSQMLAEEVRRMGQTVINIREPGGTPFGEEVRRVILGNQHPRQPLSNFDLFTIARRELRHQVMEPALASGTWVVADRSWMSSVAYQGWGEGVDIAHIVERSRETMGRLFMPDKAVILDIPVRLARDRLESRGGELDYFEAQKNHFLKMVRTGYLWVAEEFRIPIIDASPDPETVFSAILGALSLESLISAR